VVRHDTVIRRLATVLAGPGQSGLGLEQYLIERDGPPDDGIMRIHGRVNSRAIIGFLNQEAKKGKTARQGAEAQIRKLKAWGFDLAVDTEANATVVARRECR
jgi:hypothetical protein